MNMRKIYCLPFIFIFLISTRAFSQGWIVPEESRTLVSPYKFVPDSVKKGESVFIKNCQSCHGLPGKNNWAKITPPPGDPAADKFQNQEDGELFYKITSGKAPMPEFRNILSENERWNVIAFIRSFNPSYIQPNPEQKSGFTGKNVMLALTYKKEINKIMIFASEMTREKSRLPVKGAPIVIYVKRYFGNLQLGDAKMTNDKGEAFFDFPADLPADINGGLDLIAMVDDKTGTMSEAQVKVRIETGTPSAKAGLLETRSWWSTRDKAPVWLILAYSLSVLIVWGFILYIIYTVIQIRKI